MGCINAFDGAQFLVKQAEMGCAATSGSTVDAVSKRNTGPCSHSTKTRAGFDGNKQPLVWGVGKKPLQTGFKPAKSKRDRAHRVFMEGLETDSGGDQRDSGGDYG